MTFLPIVVRELRVASRRRSTFWVRSVAGLLMVVAGASLMVMVQGEPPRQVAMYLFIALTSIAALYALLSGVRSTSDCVSQEKRDGTLGLLFLTDLKGYDVVLGKLVANSLNAFYSVVAVVPMLAIPLLMGGVTPGEFGRMALVAINCLFLSLSVGVCVSSFSRSAQRAAWVTAALIAGLTLLLPLYALVLLISGASKAPAVALLMPSAGFTYYSALESVYTTGPSQFWVSFAAVHLMGWIALGVASYMAPRSWQDRPPGVRGLRWRERVAAWSYGSSAERATFRRRLLDENPIFWLIARARAKPVAVWAFLALVGLAWAWGLAKYKREWLNEGMYLGTAMLLNFVLRCWAANEATRQLAEDRKAGALELLLCTPLSIDTILRGHQLALTRQFLGPAVVTLALETLFMKATVAEVDGSPQGAWYVLYIALMIMLVADLWALYWVGMWQGLSARNHALALNGTIGRILVWPWAGFILVLIIISLFSFQNVSPPEPAWVYLLGGWFASGIVADILFAFAARKRLLCSFRLAAQQPGIPPPGWWKWLRP